MEQTAQEITQSIKFATKDNVQVPLAFVFLTKSRRLQDIFNLFKGCNSNTIVEYRAQLFKLKRNLKILGSIACSELLCKN